MNKVTNKETLRQSVIIVTGPSGAGRSTTIDALEDFGYEAVDNLPISFVMSLVNGSTERRPLASGIDVRNRDFSDFALSETLDELKALETVDSQLLFLDCEESVLVRRFSETRRRHPLSPNERPVEGLRREAELLSDIKRRADILIDTTDLSPHDLK